MNLGFIGTGEITVAMVTGFCTAEPRPQRITVSPRNAEKAAALAAAFPAVEVAADNQAVVEASDWLVLAVLPPVAEQVLAQLRFRPGQKVVSVVAGLPLARAAELVARHRDYDALHREDFARRQGVGCAVVRAPQAVHNAASGQKIAAFGGATRPSGCPMGFRAPLARCFGIARHSAPAQRADWPPCKTS